MASKHGVRELIERLSEPRSRKGVSRQAVKRLSLERSAYNTGPRVNRTLQRLLDDGAILQVKQSFRLAPARRQRQLQLERQRLREAHAQLLADAAAAKAKKAAQQKRRAAAAARKAKATAATTTGKATRARAGKAVAAKARTPTRATPAKKAVARGKAQRAKAAVTRRLFQGASSGEPAGRQSRHTAGVVAVLEEAGRTAEGPLTAAPVMLLLDVSGSMQTIPDACLRKAFSGMVAKFLDEGHAVFVMAFNATVTYGPASLVRAAAGIEAVVQMAVGEIGGRTNMCDCIAAAGGVLQHCQGAGLLDAAGATPRIFVVTDGNENGYHGVAAMLAAVAPALQPCAGLTMSILGLGTSVNMDVIMRLSQEYNGEAMFARDAADLDRIVERAMVSQFGAMSARVAADVAGGAIALSDRMPEDYRAAVQADPAAAAALAAVDAQLRKEGAAGAVLCPPLHRVFFALDSRPLAMCKVVVVGQEPYCHAGQDHGLAFSVEAGTPVPPSLATLLAEVAADVGTTATTPAQGNLASWAAQGVLLLNSVLTARQDQRGSHARIGWQAVTDRIIQAVAEANDHVVFLLWGKEAQAKAALIDEARHLVLRASHPSPLAAVQASPVAFLGSRPFSQANAFLQRHGQTPIAW